MTPSHRTADALTRGRPGLFRTYILIFVLSMMSAVAANAQVVIDDFSTPHSRPQALRGAAVAVRVAEEGAPTAERRIEIQPAADSGGVMAEVAEGGFSFLAPAETTGEAILSWDWTEPGGTVDLRAGGANYLKVTVDRAYGELEVVLVVTSGPDSVSRAKLTLPLVTSSRDFFIPFTNFAYQAPGADLMRVTEMEMRVRGTDAGLEVSRLETIVPSPPASVTATKVDELVIDNDGDNQADPGDRISYTVVFTDPGTFDVLGLDFIDTIDANTTLVAGSLETTPIALDDAYSSLGNVGIDVPAASGVLANDSDPDGSGLATPAITAFDNPSTGGGTVSVNTTDGSFTYDPPAGFNGVDTFTYTIDDGDGNSDTATVVVTVADVLWFIDSAGSGSSLGTLTDPYLSLAAFNTANGSGVGAPTAGDCIFLYTGSGPYGGGVLLLDSQSLIGQGASVALETACGASLPSHSRALPLTFGTRPVIVHAAGNGIDLAQNNTLRGFDIGNTSGFGLAGITYGTLTALEMAITGTGGSVNLSSGTLAVALDSLASAGSPGAGIAIAGSSGNFVVSSATAVSGSTSDGIFLSGNAGATLSFANLADLTVGAGRGIFAHNSGTVSISGTPNINATGGAAVDVTGTSLGAGWTFGSVSSSASPGMGINLASASGTFSASGGSVASSSGNAINIAGGSGNFSYAGSVINLSGHAVRVDGRASGSLTFSGAIDEDGNGILLTNNTGSTLDFSGGLDIDSLAANAGLTATGGGTVNVTGTNTVDTTGAAGINIAGTTIGASGVTFARVSVNGGTHGIILNGTGAVAGLTVTGDGSNTNDASGGTIQSTTDDAIVATDTKDLSLTSVSINAPAGSGIEGTNVRGTNQLRASTITAINTANEAYVRVTNTNTDMTSFAIASSSLTAQAATNGNSAVDFTAAGTSQMTLEVSGSLFEGMFGNSITAAAGQAAGHTAVLTTRITDTTFQNANPAGGIGTIAIASVGAASSNFLIENNTLDTLGLTALTAGVIQIQSFDAGILNGTIRGNDLEDIGRRGIQIAPENTTATDSRILITDNDIDATAQEAILVSSRVNSMLDVTIDNNQIGTVSPVATLGREAVEILAEDSSSLDIVVSNNTIRNVTNGSTDETVDIDAEDSATLNSVVSGNTITATGSDTDVTFEAEIEGTLAAFCLHLDANVATAPGTYELDDDDGDTSAGSQNFRVQDLATIGVRNTGTVNVNDPSIIDNGGACATPNPPTFP